MSQQKMSSHSMMDQVTNMLLLLVVSFVICAHIQTSHVSAQAPNEALEVPALKRCARDVNGDCVEKAKRLIKRAIGCDPTNPFMDCLGKRNFIPMEETSKRAIGCDPTNPFMDCMGKRSAAVPVYVYPSSSDFMEPQKRAIGCDMTNPFMDCLGKRSAMRPMEPVKRAIGCDPTNPFLDCLG